MELKVVVICAFLVIVYNVFGIFVRIKNSVNDKPVDMKSHIVISKQFSKNYVKYEELPPELQAKYRPFANKK